MKNSQDKVICLACNDTPDVEFKLRCLIDSLRAHNKSIPVSLLFNGQMNKVLKNYLEHHEIIIRNYGVDTEIKWGNPTFLKWIAIAETAEFKKILYLDIDTFVSKSLSPLFNLLNQGSFWARIYPVGGYNPLRRWGTEVYYPSPLSEDLFSEIGDIINVKPFPWFNSGIMILDDSIRDRIHNNIFFLKRLYYLFAYLILPYPLYLSPQLSYSGWWYVEEVCARFLLPYIGCTHVSEINENDCPFFFEYLARDVQDLGIVTHILASWYIHFLLEIKPLDVHDYFSAQSKKSYPGPVSSALCSTTNYLRSFTSRRWILKYMRSLIARLVI